MYKVELKEGSVGFWGFFQLVRKSNRHYSFRHFYAKVAELADALP